MPKKIQQLTQDERVQIDRMIRSEKKTPTDALRSINMARKAKKIREGQKDGVHRYVRGETHKLGALEKRGRKRSLSAQDVRKLDSVRRRLIQKAKNSHRVTYNDVIAESGLEDDARGRVCADALRAEGVACKPPRRKIYVSEDDAKLRKATVDKWLKYPKTYWHPTKKQRGVHAYHDEKSFPCPLTEKQRQRFRQNLVTGHLRKPSEGTDRGFTKPREKHSFIGMPTITISAAVAKDKMSCGTTLRSGTELLRRRFTRTTRGQLWSELVERSRSMWLWRMASAAFCVTRTTVCVTSSDLEHLLRDFQPYNSPFVFRLKLSSKNVEIVRLNISEKETIIFFLRSIQPYNFTVSDGSFRRNAKCEL